LTFPYQKITICSKYLTNLKYGVAGVARTPKVEADDNSGDYLFISSRG